MSTYNALKYDFTPPAGTFGAMTLISEQTASASASISFTSGIDSTYRTYYFKFINIHPGTDNVTLQFQGSTNGGSNYNTTMTTTVFIAKHHEDDSATQLSYIELDKTKHKAQTIKQIVKKMMLIMTKIPVVNYGYIILVQQLMSNILWNRKLLHHSG
jgi:hypothetical protein